MAFKSIGIFFLCFLALSVNVHGKPQRKLEPDEDCRLKNNITAEVVKRVGNKPLPDEENLNNYSTCLFKQWNIVNADGSLNKNASTWTGIFLSKVSAEESNDYPLVVCLTRVENEPKEKQARMIGNCFNDVIDEVEAWKKIKKED